MPDHARKTLQWHQWFAGIGPFLQLFDRDVIQRLTSGAIREQRTWDVDHVRRTRALVNQRRAAALAERAPGLGRRIVEASDHVIARDDAKTLAPASDIGRIRRAMRAAAGGRMIVPGPARRHVDLESDIATEALSPGDPRGFCWLCHQAIAP